MNDTLTLPRRFFLLTLISLLALAPACRGGGGGSGTITVPTGLVAQFVGGAATPGSVSLQPGTATGNSLFQVRVSATDLSDLFSANFQLTYDPAVVAFVDFDSSGSVLNGSGIATMFSASESSPGVLDVEASRVSTLERRFDAAAPAAGTVSIQPGSIVGNVFELRITVTDVSGFFGGSAHVQYDPAVLSFLNFDSSTSFLNGAGLGTNFNAFESAPGDVAVVATRLQTGGVAGVDVVGSSTLISLTFRGVGPSPGSAVNLGLPREACGPAGPGCQALAVNWVGGTVVNISSTPGVDINGSQELILLNFNATSATTGSGFAFAGSQFCDSTLQPGCNPISVTLAGGTLVAD